MKVRKRKSIPKKRLTCHKIPIFAAIKQLVGLPLAPRAHEESPGNIERPTS